MATAQHDRDDEEGDLGTWLLRNRRFIRSVRDSGDGSYSVTPPKAVLDERGLDDGDDVVMLPADLAGQLGIEKDPIMLVYELPLDQ